MLSDQVGPWERGLRHQKVAHWLDASGKRGVSGFLFVFFFSVTFRMMPLRQ